MLQTNPFSILAESISPIVMQGFIVSMIFLIAFGTIMDIIHKKMLSIFLKMRKKQKKMQQKFYLQVKELKFYQKQ